MPNTVKPARPAIVVGGQEKEALGQGLLGMVVHETVSGLYRCEAVFGNWGTVAGQVGFLYFDRRLLDFGKTFAIKLGNDTLFEGRITGLEAHFPEGRPPELAVLAEDRFQDLRMTRRTRTFADVTDADVIQRVASDHGLSADVDASGPNYKVLAQVNQSDLAFLRERALSIDAELWMDNSKLQVKARARRRAAA